MAAPISYAVLLVILIGVPECAVIHWVYAHAGDVIPVRIPGLLGSSAFHDACFFFQNARWVEQVRPLKRIAGCSVLLETLYPIAMSPTLSIPILPTQRKLLSG